MSLLLNASKTNSVGSWPSTIDSQQLLDDVEIASANLLQLSATEKQLLGNTYAVEENVKEDQPPSQEETVVSSEDKNPSIV